MSTQQTAQGGSICLNGVNATGVLETIRAIKADKDWPSSSFGQATNGSMVVTISPKIQGFYGCRMEDESRTEPFVLEADEPPVLYGQDLGPNPVEFVLHGLAACLTTTMAYHAASRGITIEAIDSKLEGDLDLRGFLGISDSVRKGYHNIRVHMKVKSDAKAETLRELAQFSPVYDVVSKSVPVKIVVETY